MHIIKTEKLTKSFGAHLAVDSLNLSVMQGELFGLVGPDGAGKTTTMRLLASIMDPTSGEAFVGGLNTVREAEQIKGKIGYVSQIFGLYQDLTVYENLSFYSDIYGIPRKLQPEKISEVLIFSTLTPFKDRLVKNLSGGMKQKLGLACALVHTPQILLLDEPTIGLDPLIRRNFWTLLYQLLQKGVTIFISTSDLEEAEGCHRLAFLHHGKLLACGTPKELKDHFESIILNISTEKPRETLGILRKLLPEKASRLRSNNIRIITSKPAQTLEEVKKTLAKENIPILNVTESEPNLEDVFIAMIPESSENKIHGYEEEM